MDRAIEKLRIIREFSDIYMKLYENIFQYRSLLISHKMFILGITIGIMGNLFASYIIEFHMQILRGNTFWGILIGMLVFGIGLKYTEHRLKIQMKPIEEKIDQLESIHPQIKEAIDRRLTESKENELK